MDRGGYFLHEPPGNATSWDLPSVRASLAREGVARVVAGQCQHGEETEDGDPLRKPLGL